MKTLPPVRTPDSWFDAIEEEIKKVLRKIVYAPVMKIAGIKNPVPLKNSVSEYPFLEDALRKGTVTYNRGMFSGHFNSNITRDLKKVGATWSSFRATFTIALSAIPPDLKMVLRQTDGQFRQKVQDINSHLQQNLPTLVIDQLKLSNLFDTTLYRVDKEFRKNISSIVIVPELTKYQRTKIAEEWTKNLKLFIRDFTEEETLRLRSKIRESVMKGNRYEFLIKQIQTSYGVSVRKAKFLARQETKLLTVKYQESRYTEHGVDEYRWVNVAGTEQHPTRLRHKELGDMSRKGKIFRWDDPPVTTEAGEPERKNNPGQDFNCRCSAIPVVRFKK